MQREFLQAYAELAQAQKETAAPKSTTAAAAAALGKLPKEKPQKKADLFDQASMRSKMNSDTKPGTSHVKKPVVPEEPLVKPKSAEEKEAEREAKLKAAEEKLAAKRAEAA